MVSLLLKKIDVAVVGAGPAGLMAAIGVALAGRTVEVYEKNDIIGKKLLITGKGRCNVTNDCSVQDMVEAFAPNGRFLYSALHGFDVQDTMGFFEKLGVNLKVERGRRVFPSSDCAKDVRDAMVRYARKLGVVFSTDSAVQNLKSEDGRVVGLVTKNGVYVDVGAVVVATGGASYPLTGSTGDGYEMAKAFGHTIIDLLPALVPLETREKWPCDLMGLALRNVELKLYDREKLIGREFGEMMFTHFGVGGPTVLTLSRHICSTLRRNNGFSKDRFVLSLDLKPALDEAVLDKRIQRDLTSASKKHLKNSLDKLLPLNLIPYIVELSGVDPDVQANQVSKAQRDALVHTLKDVRFHISATRPLSEAIVTSGGVKLSEVNSKDMGSKLVEGLYFAGEVLDIDAVTGGYNIQAALSTGMLAGSSAASFVSQE